MRCYCKRYLETVRCSPLTLLQVEVTVPHEFQGTGIALINKRKGQLTGSEAQVRPSRPPPHEHQP